MKDDVTSTTIDHLHSNVTGAFPDFDLHAEKNGTSVAYSFATFREAREVGEYVLGRMQAGVFLASLSVLIEPGFPHDPFRPIFRAVVSTDPVPLHEGGSR